MNEQGSTLQSCPLQLSRAHKLFYWARFPHVGGGPWDIEPSTLDMLLLSAAMQHKSGGIVYLKALVRVSWTQNVLFGPKMAEAPFFFFFCAINRAAVLLCEKKVRASATNNMVRERL